MHVNTKVEVINRIKYSYILLRILTLLELLEGQLFLIYQNCKRLQLETIRNSSLKLKIQS